MTAKKNKRETPNADRMPSWTNYHNKEAFGRLSETLKKEHQWNSTELLLCELLARFSKSPTVRAKDFFAAIPERYLKNILPGERLAKVQSFFGKLAETGLCEVVSRGDDSGEILTVQLTQPATPEERKIRESVEPVLKYLRSFYRRRDFKVMYQESGLNLANPEMVQASTPVSMAVLLHSYCTRISSLVFSTKEIINPTPQFTQGMFGNSDKPFIYMDFPALMQPGAGKQQMTPTGTDGTEQPFCLVLPADVNIKDLIRDFMVPLILVYLQDEKNKEVYKAIHHEWSKKLHASALDAQLDTDARIERTLLAASTTDAAYFASVHVLTNVLRRFKLGNLPAAPAAVIYQATRFVYDYSIACRQLQTLEKVRKAEQAKDEEIIINYLLREVYSLPEGATIAGPLPVSRKMIEDLPDCTRQTTLGLKYRSVRDLMPLQVTESEQVPCILELDGHFLHRWHLVNYFVVMQHAESRLVSKTLARFWSETGIPRPGNLVVPEEFVSRPFQKAVQFIDGYRSAARIELTANQFGREFDVFVQYFFPSAEMARTYKVEHLLRSAELDTTGGKGPKYLVRNEIDRTIYRENRGFSQRPYMEMLHLEYSSIRKEAIDLAKERLGGFGFFWFMFRNLFAVPGDAAASIAESGRKVDAEGRASSGGNRPGVAANRKPGSTLERKSLDELAEVLEKVPQLLRIDVKTLQSLVEPVVKSLNPDIRNLGDKEARDFVKRFIAKAPSLHTLPFRTDPVFVRFVLLTLRQNNARA